jgi:fibronectin type 3 domain-containing protein
MTRRLTALSLATALALCLAGPATAELATVEEGRLVAENWASYMAHWTGGWGGSIDPSVVLVSEIVVSDTLFGWCFSMSPSGHIVVPVRKELPPVKSYSEIYGMRLDDPDGYPKLMEHVLRSRARVVERAYGSMEATEPARGGPRLGVENRAEWDRFAVDTGVFSAGLTSQRFEPLTEVGPLLTTAWHQGPPYNNLCPMGDGGRTVVGCVATAAAQILRYHASPSEGFGSHCYYWDGDNSCGGSTSGSQLCADYEDAYDWENMPNSCAGCSTAEQDALAELCYEVGVAFDMSYGACGSGAYTADALNVFPDYFGYSTAIDRENRSAHSKSSWFNIIQVEINQDHPIQYRILGHSIVCDGWRDTGGTQQYHMNYGWADSHNAWYVLDNLFTDGELSDEYLIRRIIPPDAAWVDATGGLPLGDTGDGMGVAWCDYDGDGDSDLYITNDGSANVLARNDGLAGFTDATGGPLGDAGSGAAAVWGDYDGDGDFDLYLVNTGASNRLMRNDGGDTFTDVTAGPLGDSGSGYGASWVDYDLDGDLDLYVANSGASNKLFRNDGGSFVDATSAPMDDSGAGRGLGWSDYDADGDPDLYLANYGGANKLFRNDGGGSFSDVTSGPLGDTGNSMGVAWADYDGDGDMDLYVSNYGSANKLLRNEGGGTFVDATAGPLDDSGNGTGVGWGDYDNDGDLDLYLVNDGGANRLFRNLGDGIFTDVTSDPLGDTGDGQGMAWGDYDGDGRLDMMVANRNGANILLERGTSNTAGYLRVNLEGVSSNGFGIGALLRAVTSDGSEVREVTAGSGFLSQDSSTVEFGLGLLAEVDTLEVRWPSGIVNVYGPISANQTVVITELAPPSVPAGVTATPSEAGVEVSWHGVTDPQLDHYRVERDTTSAFGPGAVSFTTADTMFVDFPLVDVREYFYRVMAAGTGGNESAPSDTVSAYPAQTPPLAPTNVVATAGDALIELAWDESTSPDTDHYRIERDTSSLFLSPVSIERSIAILTDGPLGGNELFYRVFTVDLGGLESAPSETVSCSPLVTAPSPPTGLVATSGNGVVELDWAANPEIDIAGYVIYRDVVPEIDAADSLAATWHTFLDDETAENYEVYWYAVSAIDLGGLVSAPSDTVAGAAAPGGAVFVQCGPGGYENGTYTYPYNELSEGLAVAGEGAVVLVLPGECAGNIVLDDKTMIVGMSGAEVTEVFAVTGSVLAAVAGSDSAKVQGLTLNGMDSCDAAFECSDTDVSVIDCVLKGASSGAEVHGSGQPSFTRTTFLDDYQGILCSDTANPVVTSCVFRDNQFCGVSNSADPGPVLGGTLETANDFINTGFLSIYSTGPAVISAELNYWGDDCPDSLWFVGNVDYVPWTDTLHVASYTECPSTGVEEGLPAVYALGENIPNPFNPVTRIQYDVPAPGGRVELSIYNVSGALVRELESGHVEPGRHVAVWDGRDRSGARVSSGVYFYRLEAADFKDQRKMVLLK